MLPGCVAVDRAALLFADDRVDVCFSRRAFGGCRNAATERSRCECEKRACLCLWVGVSLRMVFAEGIACGLVPWLFDRGRRLAGFHWRGVGGLLDDGVHSS